MPNPAKQKIKLLYIMEALLEDTDEDRCMSAQDLIDYLAERDVEVERKTIFSDIATLKEFGLDIGVSKKKDKSGYYIMSRDFELAELKIIVEAILSSRYISAKKSKALIEKLVKLVGPSDRKALDREVKYRPRGLIILLKHLLKINLEISREINQMARERRVQSSFAVSDYQKLIRYLERLNQNYENLSAQVMLAMEQDSLF